MEAFKSINIKSGRELNKPRILAIAPTANAAFIIGGETIDSAFAMDGSNYNDKKLPAERESDLQYMHEDVSTVFIYEISMVVTKGYLWEENQLMEIYGSFHLLKTNTFSAMQN